MLTVDKNAVEIHHVSKKFRVHVERNGTLKEKILYARRARHREFVALDDICLSVRKGSTMGLLGMNGSGKSTLLKLISRIIYPDKGSVTVNGRVSSLLELGAGFHPDFTGRENIYMNGALLGLSKKEINRKLDEIIDFSELGDFIEQPVRSYSSGMYMRLAFSVAVAVDPEILLIDEILAVGDAAFEAKCMSRIKRLQAQNKTIIIVSHDMNSVERFCDTAAWLHNSHLKMTGEPVSCIRAYLDEVFRNAHDGTSVMTIDRLQRNSTSISVSTRNESTEEVGDNGKQNRFGNGNARITDITIRSNLGNDLVECGGQMIIEIKCQTFKSVPDVIFGFGVFTEDGIQVYGTNTFLDRLSLGGLETGPCSVTIDLPRVDLLPGVYLMDIAIHAEDGEPYDYWRQAVSFQVMSDRHDVGLCRMEHQWSFEFVRRNHVIGS